MSKETYNSIPRLYDYANYCATAVYRFSRESSEDIILYSMVPFFKDIFFLAFLNGDEEPDWESIEENMEAFVEGTGDLEDRILESSPLERFFGEVVDGILKEFEQRTSQSKSYFKAMAQISGSIKELVDSINRGEVKLDDLVNQIMDRIIGALDEETVA